MVNIRPNRGIGPKPPKGVKTLKRLDKIAQEKGLKHWWELEKRGAK